MDVSPAGPTGTRTDDAGTDAGPELDLTPRRQEGRRRGRRGLLASLALVAVVAALVVIAVQALGEASLFFLNADEAVEQRDDLGTDRFRLQGSVVPGSVDETVEGVDFQVVYNDVAVDVVHRGDPPELFQPDIPVVLEGNWSGAVFASDRILVKHTSEYEAENQERIDDADDAHDGS
jgi:cytochrome c-type biogenesis protein CcmE